MKLNEIQEPDGQQDKAGPQDYTLFLDMDGVLADFSKKAASILNMDQKDMPDANQPKDKAFNKKLWDTIREYDKDGNFWGELDPMPDFKQLWEFVKIHNPSVLTAAGSNSPTRTKAEKEKWVNRYMGNDIPFTAVVHSEQKGEYAEDNGVLIDDRHRSIDSWVSAGGIGILHTSAANTIRELKKLGFN